MRKKHIKDAKSKILKILKNDEKYKDYDIDFILINKKEAEKVIALAIKDGEMISIDLPLGNIRKIDDVYYNYDDYLFYELEAGKEIGLMNMYVHYCIWKEVRDVEPQKIKNKLGFQNYLKYCKENKITKEKLDKEMKEKDTPDIMKYYKQDKNKIRER